MKKKVLAYIIKKNKGKIEFLIHSHRDFPDAGLQVPAGTVEPNEDIENALLREVEEESGLTDLKIIKKLDIYQIYFEDKKELHERHVFLLEAENCEVDSWSHTVFGSGQDNGLIFCYKWYPIENLPELSGNQGDSIHLI